MANKRITQLDVGAVPATTDLVLVLTDPAGTKVAKKCTIDNLVNTLMNYSGAPLGRFIPTNPASQKSISSGFGSKPAADSKGADLYVDKTNGFLYICTNPGNPGTWVKVGTQS